MALADGTSLHGECREGFHVDRIIHSTIRAVEPALAADPGEVVSQLFEPGSPWENGYCGSFNSKLCDALLNLEVFYSLHEAEVLIEELAAALQHRAPV